MPFEVIRSEIAEITVDAIVSFTNSTFWGSRSIDRNTSRTAGSVLLNEFHTPGDCETGQATITRGYRLPCKYVIHTVCPLWQGGRNHEKEKLASCYQASLELAIRYGCESVAVPLISTEKYGYPKEEVLKLATDSIRDCLFAHEIYIYLVISEIDYLAISNKLFSHIQTFINDSYHWSGVVKKEISRRKTSFISSQFTYHPINLARRKYKAIPFWRKFAFLVHNRKKTHKAKSSWHRNTIATEDFPEDNELLLYSFDRKESESPEHNKAQSNTAIWIGSSSLTDYVSQQGEGFRDVLLRKIDESGMTDVECYKRANVDRKLFNKIKNQQDYNPSKSTVLAFTIALKLPLKETEDMLRKAGFSLSHSNKFDLIVEYFITNGIYDIFEINEALFSFNQKLLGSVTWS